MINLKVFVHEVPLDNDSKSAAHKSASVQVMARCLASDKQLPGPKFTKFDAKKDIWCGVTRPQKVHL